MLGLFVLVVILAVSNLLHLLVLATVSSVTGTLIVSRSVSSRLTRWVGRIVDGAHQLVVARAAGIPYRKIDPLKLDAQLITRTLSRPNARKHGVLPYSLAYRYFWSVWIGYLTASVLVSVIWRVLFGVDTLYESVLYPFFAVVTGLAFFALGSNYWGGCYGFGVAFFALPGLMFLHIDWLTAPGSRGK